MMKRIRASIFFGLFLLLTSPSIGLATPIVFQLDGVTIVGELFATTQTYNPVFPIVGSGDLDLGAGTGTVSLQDYTIAIDVLLTAGGTDALVTMAGWNQTITAIDGSGNLTSTGGGTPSCANLGGVGNLVCGALPPTVSGWAPLDGASPSSAVIDMFAQTITIVDNSNATAGTITQLYSYTFVPEASTALLLGMGLLGLGVAGRRS
jgi:hypothetical protein